MRGSSKNYLMSNLQVAVTQQTHGPNIKNEREGMHSTEKRQVRNEWAKERESCKVSGYTRCVELTDMLTHLAHTPALVMLPHIHTHIYSYSHDSFLLSHFSEVCPYRKPLVYHPYLSLLHFLFTVCL